MRCFCLRSKIKRCPIVIIRISRHPKFSHSSLMGLRNCWSSRWFRIIIKINKALQSLRLNFYWGSMAGC